MSDKRVAAAAEWIEEYADFYIDVPSPEQYQADAADLLAKTDAADDHVRVPRENLAAMIDFVNAHYRVACDVLPRPHQTRRALDQIADDLVGWLDGQFKRVPDGQA